MNKKTKNFIFMAFAKGNGYEAKSFTKHWGIAQVKVIAVNPSKEELASILDNTEVQEPVYTSEVNKDGHVYKQARINFYLKTIPEKNNGIEKIFRLSYSLLQKKIVGSTSGKCKVIDVNGDTAWATAEEVKGKKVPMYKTGPAAITNNYRPCLVGEEELTNFFKILKNIPKARVYENGAFVPNTKVNPEDCFARLDGIEKLFNGDFKELKEAIANLDQEKQNIKVIVAIKTTQDNKQYETCYEKVFPPYAFNFEKVATEIITAKNSGRYVGTEFCYTPLHEYELQSSSFNNKKEKEEEENVDVWGDSAKTQEKAQEKVKEEDPFASDGGSEDNIFPWD